MSYIDRKVCMPMDLLRAFSKHTGLFWSGIEIEGAICDAIAAAMQPRPVQAQVPQVHTGEGYQWKQVFLPHGTVLRASFGRQPYYAVVEGSQIKYGEFSLSPSAFANLQGSGNRNAWKAVWLRFPGFKDWVRADECRAVRRAVTARMFGPDQPEESGETEAAPAAPAGDYQQRYTEKRPSHHEIVPYYQLLREFPEGETEAVAAEDESEAPPECEVSSQSGHPAPGTSGPGKQHNGRQKKHGKRHQARRKHRR